MRLWCRRRHHRTLLVLSEAEECGRVRDWTAKLTRVPSASHRECGCREGCFWRGANSHTVPLCPLQFHNLLTPLSQILGDARKLLERGVEVLRYLARQNIRVGEVCRVFQTFVFQPEDV